MIYMSATRIVTGEVRFSYCYLLKPKQDNFGNAPKYSTSILIPKTDTDTITRIQTAIQAAKEEAKITKWNGQIPPILQNSILPLKDGDIHRDRNGNLLPEACRGHWVLNASTGLDYPPKVVDLSFNPIIDHSTVYSGMWGRIALNFAGYNSNGNMGVSAYIAQNVQKTRDDDPLGGSAPDAESDFGAPVQQPNMAQNVANINNFDYGLTPTQAVPTPNPQPPIHQHPQTSPVNPFAT